MRDIDDDDGDWHGLVMRSELDSKVWVGVLPAADHATNMMASTSVRKVKAFVKSEAERVLYRGEDVTLRWVLRSNGDWELRAL